MAERRHNAFPYTNPAQHPMDIKAVDPATGDYLWVAPKAQPAVQISAGFLAGDVYFVGSLDGMVRAYDAQTGEKLRTQPRTRAGGLVALVRERHALLGHGGARTLRRRAGRLRRRGVPDCGRLSGKGRRRIDLP